MEADVPCQVQLHWFCKSSRFEKNIGNVKAKQNKQTKERKRKKTCKQTVIQSLHNVHGKDYHQ